MSKPDKKLASVLGLAFIFQFITSFGSGVFLKSAWDEPGNIVETMFNIASQPMLFRANILVDIVTVLGVIFLGVVMYIVLRQENEIMALAGMSFYLLEGAMLAVSRLDAFRLLQISGLYVSSGQPAHLEPLAGFAIDSMDFVGGTLHTLVFCVGGYLFYSLLFKSRLVPRWLSVWALIAMIPLTVGMVTLVFGYELPFVLFVPYVPFELTIGIWLLVKGFDRKVALQVAS